jgi:hypothetical protein
MKTNRMILLAVLLGALFAREAQAFYNPSSGRWLNRDPLDEQGFMLLTMKQQLAQSHDSEEGDEAPARHKQEQLNLYAFVHNDPIDQVDYLGLYGSSVDNAVRACMALPTPAARAKCFKDLIDLLGGGQSAKCCVLKSTTQVAKKAASTLGGCKGADSCVVLQQKSMAWGALVMARIAENKHCWGGGNPGHKKALKDAWNAIAKCTKFQVNKGCTSM